MSVLVSCKKCYAGRVVGAAPDKCGECGSPEITVHRATELDPANPSGFAPAEKGQVATPMPPLSWRGRALDSYEWNGFMPADELRGALDAYEWNSYPTYADFTGTDRSATVSNSHLSEIAEHIDLTLSELEQSYNRAARGLRGYGGVRGVPGVDVATSELTAEWKRQESKPKSERLEFPSERKITVK